jgi:hypothetical protein
MNRANLAAGALTMWIVLLAAGPCLAAGKKIDAKADQALRDMSDYLANLKSFSVQVDETIDDVQDNGQKIQVANRRKLTVKRPNRLKATLSGDIADREFYYDGKTITLFDKGKKVYATAKASDNIPAMMDEIHDKMGQSQALADFLFPDPYKILTEHVQRGTYVGLHHVGTVKCHHLAFRQKNIDWQIWIQAGSKPLPRKMVITHKRVAGGPQYTARLSKWDVSLKLGESMFEFQPPEDARKIDLDKLLGAAGPGKQTEQK